MNPKRIKREQEKSYRNIILVLTIIVIVLMGIFIYSQQKRLNEYDNWYCTEVYGLDQNCK